MPTQATPLPEFEANEPVTFNLQYKKGKLELKIKTTPEFREVVKNNTPQGRHNNVEFNGRLYRFYDLFRSPDLHDLAAKIASDGYNVVYNQYNRGPSTNGQINIAHLFMYDPADGNETTFTFNTVYSKESLETYATVLRNAISHIIESFLQPINIECSLVFYTQKS